MKLILCILTFGMATISTSFAKDVYSKFDDKTMIVTKTVNETVDIEAVKSNRQSLEASCTEQLAAYNSLIAEAKKAGVK